MGDDAAIVAAYHELISSVECGARIEAARHFVFMPILFGERTFFNEVRKAPSFLEDMSRGIHSSELLRERSRDDALPAFIFKHCDYMEKMLESIAHIRNPNWFGEYKQGIAMKQSGNTFLHRLVRHYFPVKSRSFWDEKLKAGEGSLPMSMNTCLLMYHAFIIYWLRTPANIPVLPVSVVDEIEANHLRERAKTLFKEEKYHEAILHYNRALYHFWSYGVLYSNRALCYLKLGDFKAARSDGYRCTKLSPTYVKGHYLYVMAWYKLGKAERALECLEKAFRLCVTDPPPPDLLNLRKEITDYLESDSFAVCDIKKVRKKDAAAAGIHPSKSNGTANTLAGHLSSSQVCDNSASDDAINDVPTSDDPANDGPTSDDPATDRLISDDPTKDGPTSDDATKDVPVSDDPANIGTTSDDPSTDGPTSGDAATDGPTSDDPIKDGPSSDDPAIDGPTSDDPPIYGPTSDNATKEVPTMNNPTARGASADNPSANEPASDDPSISPSSADGASNHHPSSIRPSADNLGSPENGHSAKSPAQTDMKSEDVKVDKSSDDIPVAVCRFVDCLKYNPSRNIVFSKADVKVYVQILCYAHCCMDFHVGCWKKLWVSQVAVEKDFLGTSCLTPDCTSTISQIRFIDHGKVKREISGPPPSRSPAVRKPALKLPLSSLSKIQRKEKRKAERKERRRQRKADEAQAALEANMAQEVAPEEEAPAAEVPQPEYIPVDRSPVAILQRNSDGPSWNADSNDWLSSREHRRNKKRVTTVTLDEFVAEGSGARSASPEPAEEGLEDTIRGVFSDLLHRYGPLSIDNTLIQQELQNFPLEAQYLLETRGGLENLLLSSSQFTVVDGLLCLAQSSSPAQLPVSSSCSSSWSEEPSPNPVLGDIPVIIRPAKQHRPKEQRSNHSPRVENRSETRSEHSSVSSDYPFTAARNMRLDSPVHTVSPPRAPPVGASAPLLQLNSNLRQRMGSEVGSVDSERRLSLGSSTGLGGLWDIPSAAHVEGTASDSSPSEESLLSSQVDALQAEKQMLVAHNLQLMQQDAAQKEEIQQLRAQLGTLSEVTRRAQVAEADLLRLKLQIGKDRLQGDLELARKSLTKYEAQLQRMMDLRQPALLQNEVRSIVDMWKRKVDEIEILLATTEADFNEQILSVEGGTPLSQLPVLDIPIHPTFPEPQEPSPQVDSSSSRQAVGSSRDSLNLLTLSQRFKAHAAPGAPSTGVKSSPHCLPQGLLKPMPNGPAASGLSFLLHSRSQEEGDDIEHAECSICCEALKVKPTVQLDCSHVFHKICVQTWLDRNQTCPHCRAHTLMPDEYPTLGASSKHSRRR